MKKKINKKIFHVDFVIKSASAQVNFTFELKSNFSWNVSIGMTRVTLVTFVLISHQLHMTFAVAVKYEPFDECWHKRLQISDAKKCDSLTSLSIALWRDA